MSERQPGRIATVSWPRLLAITVGPFLLIAIAYFLFSDRPWSEVVSYSNLVAPTVWSPWPVFSILCLVVCVIACIWAIAEAVMTRGGYAWIADGTLRVGLLRSVPLSTLHTDGLEVQGTGTRRRLVVRTRRGRPVVIRLGYATLDPGALSLLETRIRQAEETATRPSP